MNEEGQNSPEKITKLTLTPNENEKFCRHLGILIDNKLTYKYHLDNLRIRISKIIFSMIIDDSYKKEGNLYGHEDSFGVTYNTTDQIKEIENKFKVKVTLEDTFLANGGYTHSIYSIQQ